MQYKELFGALQGLADVSVPKEQEWADLGQGLSPAKESERLRSMVENDEQYLAQLEELFRTHFKDSSLKPHPWQHEQARIPSPSLTLSPTPTISDWQARLIWMRTAGLS